jgi:hypothetical protein
MLCPLVYRLYPAQHSKVRRLANQIPSRPSTPIPDTKNEESTSPQSEQTKTIRGD